MQTDSINIFQIYFAPDQLGTLDPSFKPYDNSLCPTPDEREFYVFRKEYLSQKTGPGLTGFVSWKFGQKTHISGKEFLEFCSQNPGHDVYFINPFPMEIYHGNVWQQGDMWHPGMKRLAHSLFEQCGIKIDLDKMPRSLRTTAYCNFWAGSQRFWDRYMAFCLPIYEFIKNEMPERDRQALFSIADHSRSASYFSFIFERLFSTFLVLNPDIRACAYTYSRSQLAKLYPKRQVDFICSLQDLEARFPNEAEPILKNPKLMKAIADFEKSIAAADTPLRRGLFTMARRLWHAFPLRNAILASPYWKIKATQALNALNPGHVFLRSDRHDRSH